MGPEELKEVEKALEDAIQDYLEADSAYEKARVAREVARGRLSDLMFGLAIEKDLTTPGIVQSIRKIAGIERLRWVYMGVADQIYDIRKGLQDIAALKKRAYSRAGGKKSAKNKATKKTKTGKQ